MGSILSIDTESFQRDLQSHLESLNAPKYQTPVFKIRDIPAVMRTRMGWPVAAKLMERWFNGAAYKMPTLAKRSLDPYRLSQLPSVHLDETSVTMKWALGFERVKNAQETLKNKWNSHAGIEQLKRRIKNQETAHSGQNIWRFGNLNNPAKILEDTCQVNFLVFGKMLDPMDDFYGAMGESQLNLAVSGLVTTEEPGKMSVEIDELGFYLRDCYDFNDSDSFVSQPLGCWGFQGVDCWGGARPGVNIGQETANVPPDEAQRRKYIVQNKHFLEWRDKNGHGGDFMVLSDVHRMRLAVPLKFAW